MKVFEVFLVPGHHAGELISAEVQRETNAQVMTPEEARKVGFAGLPDPGGAEVRLIAVAKRDAPWIHRVLETSEMVATFRAHDVD
jgi:hypothetical protein